MDRRNQTATVSRPSQKLYTKVFLRKSKMICDPKPFQPSSTWYSSLFCDPFMSSRFFGMPKLAKAKSQRHK